ncbi:MAG: transglutaminase family protein [Propionibacteriaceae bacterium]
MTTYEISHVTTYTYDEDVTGSYGLYGLRPRELPWQQNLAHEVTIEPAPRDLATHLDAYGNTRSYFHVTTPHTQLVITGRSTVQVVDPPGTDAPVRSGALELPWEQCRPGLRSDLPEAWRAIDFTLESPLVDLPIEVADYAQRSLRPGRALGEAVVELMHRIHDDFAYKSGSTTVTTRVADVLEQRTGVCQDFAHLMIAGLRSQGLAAQYVSGYLATRAVPGRPRQVGADASHAWVGCWVPGEDWLHLDPTNDRLVDDTHATVAWGRDYGDVAPVKGVIFTSATTSTMKVGVDMVRAESTPTEPG